MKIGEKEKEEGRIHILNNSWGVGDDSATGQPFKVSISDCQDVADLIEGISSAYRTA